MVSACQFILGNAVLFDFKVSLVVLESCSVRLEILKFILKVAARNCIDAVEAVNVG